MKIPERINLLGESFQIKWTNGDCHGEIDISNKILKLDSSLKDKPDELFWVLLHESSHYFKSYYFDNHVLGEEHSSELDEFFANALSNFIYSLLKQVEFE